MDDLLDGISEDEFPGKLEILYYIGLTYYQFSDYRLALKNCHKAIAVKPASYNMNSWLSCCNTIGLCYGCLGNTDSSDYFFKKTIAAAKNYQWRAIARGNLADNDFKKGNFDTAAALLEQCYQETIDNNDLSIRNGTALALADVYLAQGKPEAAAVLIAKAEPLVRSWNRLENCNKLYPLLSKLYAYQGKPALSNLYLDSAIFLKDSLARKFSSLKLMAANQKLAQQQHQIAMDSANSEKRIRIYQRNGLLALLLIGICATLVFYKYKAASIGN